MRVNIAFFYFLFYNYFGGYMDKLSDILDLMSTRDVIYEKEKIQKFFINHYSNSLINEIIKTKSPIIYERFTNLMQYKIDVSEIDEKRNYFIKNTIFNSIDNDKEIFTFFNNINEENYKELLFTDIEKEDIRIGIKNNKLDVVLKNIANTWLNEYIIYYFFHENYYNFLVNLQGMLHYIRNVKLDLISNEHIKFYNDCHCLYKLSFKDKIEFFKNNYSKKDIESMFYDDMRIVKNHSYQNLVNSLLKIDKNSNLYNDSLSSKYNYPIYYLNGEKFNAMIRWIMPNNGRSKEEYDKYVNSKKEKDYYSFSYISDRNIGSIGKNGNGFTLLYSDINPEYITHVYHDDAGSSYLLKEKHFITDKFNEIHTPSSLIMDTKYYNEIVIKKEKDGIKPSALVCFNEINTHEYAFAKEYKLPILLINSNKYYQNNDYTDFNDYDTYCI